MPVVAEFFKGTVSSALEKLAKPAGLVPAAVLVLLNLVFVYPEARDAQFGWARRFSGLEEGWQIVVVLALILAVGLLLQGAAVAVISVLQGYAWRTTPLGSWLKSRQSAKLDELRAKWSAAGKKGDHQERETLAWDIARRFAADAEPAPDAAGVDKPDRHAGPSSDGPLDPTALGNSLRAIQHTIKKRYGIDIVALLGHLQAAEDVKDSPALAAVKEERDSLDLFANLAAVFAFFALECLAFFGERGSWPAALFGALALPLSYSAYHVAVARTRSWGDSVAMLFDLHRNDLREQLKIREPEDAADERELWRRASRFFRAPGAAEASELLDPAKPDPAAKVVARDDLSPSLVQASVIDHRSGRVDGATPLQSISYRILVARIGEAADEPSSEMLVDDPRVAVIEAAPTPSTLGASSVVLADGAASALMWRFARLKRGGSRVLAYTLPIWLVIASPERGQSGLAGAVERLAEVIPHRGCPDITFRRVAACAFRLAAEAPSNERYTISLRYLGAEPLVRPKLRQGGEDKPARIEERQVAWQGVRFDDASGVVTIDLPSQAASQ